MALDLRNVGYASGEILRNEQIQECKASEYQDRYITVLRGREEKSFVHSLWLHLKDVRLNDVDCKSSLDVAYVEENSNVVEVWSSNPPGRENNWTMTPRRINLRNGLKINMIRNNDFSRIYQMCHPSIVTTVSYMAQRVVFTGCKDGSVRMFDSYYHLMDNWVENMTNISDIHYNLTMDEFAVVHHKSIRGPKTYHLYGATLFSFYRKKPVGYCFKHYEPAESVRFSPNGRLLATLDRQGQLYIWDRKAPEKPIRHIHSGDPLENKKLEFSPDEKFIASKNMGVVNIYELGTGQTYAQLPVSRLATQNFDFTYGALGRTVAMGGADGFLRIWDLSAPLNFPTAVQEFMVGAPIRRIRCTMGSIYNCVC